ncbi:MAG: CPBP family intramembrane glutamic endopeptidase [Bacteroidales bacterium]
MNTSKLFQFFVNSHVEKFLGICFLAHLLIDIPFIWVPEESTTNDSLEMIEQSGGKAAVLFASVLLAPIFETFIYQFSVIKLFRWIVKKTLWNFSIAIPVSAVLFSISHSYSIYYQINTFLIGILYAVIFYLAQYRKDWPAFLVVVVLHASWNLFACIMDEIVY